VTTVLRLAVLTTAALVLAACGGSDGGGGDGDRLSGRVTADGSSTVGPLVTFAAEQFQREHTGVQITVGVSGTGGGFERFCRGETDLSDASRPIKDEEQEVCERNGVEHAELLVANDGIAIVANRENDWVDCLTTAQLKSIWEPGSQVENWRDVDASFPNEKLTLAGPGTDSGTFDFFTDKINGEEGASRSDYHASENDNVIAQAVSGDKGGLGYFGLSYFEENQDQLEDVKVDSGNGCVAPTRETVQAGTYSPLSRPLFVYVKRESMQRPEVNAFVSYLVESQQANAEGAKFVPLTEKQTAEARAELEAAEAAS
jgi:phosphate transport system substrate-binding protein